VVGLGGGALGLPAALTGGLSGFSVGAIQTVAANKMRGDRWYEGVSQAAIVGAIGGGVAGGVVGAMNPQNLPAKVLVGGMVGGGVSAGTQVAFNVAGGRPWNEGVGAAFGMGFANGAIDAFTDYYGDMLVERAMVPRPARGAAGDADGWRRPGDVDDADGRLRRWMPEEWDALAVRKALDVFRDPNASRTELFWAQNRLLDAGVRGVWQGGESLEMLRGDDGTTVFWHGTSSRHRGGFEEGARIRATGEEGVQDFGKAFYTTRKLSEAIDWASMRTSGMEDRYVIAIEVERAQLDTLVGKEMSPFEYRHGVTRDEYVGNIRKTPEEIEVIRSSADYMYGPVSPRMEYPGWEQHAFKSQRALDVLNASPRSIYRVTSDSQLELVRRIVPNPGGMPDDVFLGLGDLPSTRARQFQSVVQEAQAPINVVGGMASQRHHHLPSEIDVDVYIEKQYRDMWTPELRRKLGPVDFRPMNDELAYEMGWSKLPPGLRKPYIRFAPNKSPVWVRED